MLKKNKIAILEDKIVGLKHDNLHYQNEIKRLEKLLYGERISGIYCLDCEHLCDYDTVENKNIGRSSTPFCLLNVRCPDFKRK